MPPGHVLVDREIAALLGSAIRPVEDAAGLLPEQVQPASLDLPLGATLHRIRASFLPGRTPLRERLAELQLARLSLEGEGAVLEKGEIALVPLDVELDLPAGVAAFFNPRSTTGRCDVFARVLADGHPRFDEAPAGFRGRPWLEIAPLSFPVLLRRGDRLCQMRLSRGASALSAEELRAEHARAPLYFDDRGDAPTDDLRIDSNGTLALHLGLAGRDPAGWRALSATGVLAFGHEAAHDAREFFEPVHAPGGRSVLEPGAFHLFASRERVRIPPHLAAEMLPADVRIGEMRNNYAGFFDTGFGLHSPGDDRPPGTPAVLEVRARDVPFLVEDGQVFFQLRFHRTSGRPERLYAEGRLGASYARQDLALARCFRAI